MMSTLPLEVLLPVFGIVGVGWLASIANKKVGEWVQQLNSYAYYVALPSLIIRSLWNTRFSPIYLKVVTLNFITIALSMGLIYALTTLAKVKEPLRSCLSVMGVFGNVAYLGYPLSYFAFGNKGLSIAIVNSLAYNLSVFTLGIWLIRKSSGLPLSRSLADPLLISTSLGALLSLLGLPKLKTIDILLNSLGSSALPVALFSLGAFIGYRGVSSDSLKLALPLTFIKFSTLPLILTILNTLFVKLGKLEYGVSLIQAFAPLAVTNFIIAVKYDLDVKAIANAVIISTLVSVFLYALLLTSLS